MVCREANPRSELSAEEIIIITFTAGPSHPDAELEKWKIGRARVGTESGQKIVPRAIN